MFDNHTTKNGSLILICQMSDDHLLNMINLITEKISNCVDIVLAENIVANNPQARLLAAFKADYSYKAIAEKAERQLRSLHSKLQPYVLEACLRESTREKASSMLQQAYKRDRVMPDLLVLSLNSLEDVEDTYTLTKCTPSIVDGEYIREDFYNG